MSSTPLTCLRCGTALQPGAATRCPVCAASNPRLLALGGLAFAALAVLLLGGMSLVLLKAFAHEPVAVNAPREPVVELPPTPAPTGDTTVPVRPVVVEPDVADLARPVPPAAPAAVVPLPERRGGVAPEAPVIAVKIEAGGVPGVDQARIDAAIAAGVAYLKAQQAKDGSWPGGPPVGYTALGGLTLLECKVPADDPHVRKAAGFVRTSSAQLFATYELALAILFLDRLGDPRDKATIQGLALRLVAGQNEAGGWTYVNQPMLTPPEMKQLLVFLKSHRPAAPLAKALQLPVGLDKQLAPPARPGKQLQGKPDDDDPFGQLEELLRAIAEPGSVPKVNLPAEPALPPPPAKKTEVKAEKVPPPAKKLTPINPRTLAARLQPLPAVQLNVKKGNLPLQAFMKRSGDNSNTQFALMGLWAARRHDVPTERTLRYAQQRFQQSQGRNDGGWGYHVNARTTDTMTCVGLIGLAMGHGVNDELGKNKDGRVDQQIQQGLATLGRYLGTPALDVKEPPPLPNLYFLWSVERVAMLYDLKTIGGKDWYGWGAQALLPNQQPDGSWSGSRYHGAAPHTDTCFALLFLKRSNLVPDLTEDLRLHMVIRDPEAK